MAEQIDSKIPKIRFKGFEDGWLEDQLGERVEFFSGLTYSPRNVQKGVGTLVLRSSNVKNGEIVNADNVYVDPKIVNSKNVELGDIAVVVRNGSRSLIGKHAQIKNRMDNTVIGAFMTGIHSENPAFTNALLDSPQFDKEIAKNLGATINQITTGAFRQMMFRFPRCTEQTQIGEYFRELDRLIGLHQCKHDKLVTLKKAMLQKMFPQPGATTPEIRFKGFSGDWVEKTLAEISEIKTGPFGSALHAKDYVSDGVPIITTEHFKYWQLPETKEGLPQVSNSDYERLKNYVLKHGDIVFSRVGSIDINAHVEEKQNGWLFSGRVLRVRTPLSIDSEYLHHELSTDRVRKSVVERGVGQTMPSINTGILGRTAVFLPEQKAEQQKIGSYFRTLDSLISKHAIQLQKLQQIKSACLEKMFV